MKFLKRIIPRFIGAPIARQISIAGAFEESKRLDGIAQRLRDEHLRNLRVFAGREALLDALPKNGIVAEGGVAGGDFSQQILERCHPRQLHLIDHWESRDPQCGEDGYRQVSDRFGKQLSSGQVVLHRGYSWEMLSLLPDESLDWVYLDADHSYDAVKKDLLAVRSKLKPLGIISGHDYTRWGSQLSRFGVVEAVNEFCLTFNYEMVFLTLEENMFSSYAIRAR